MKGKFINMKRRIAVISALAVLLLCGVVWARMGPLTVGGQGSVSVGIVCTTDAVDVEFTDGTNTGTFIAAARGQSFKVSTDGAYLYSIEMELSASPTRNVTMRWGPGSDLSSTYYGEVVVSVSTQGYYEFVFQDTTHQLSSDTTYYFGVITTGATTTLFRDESSPTYADGAYYYASSDGFNMNNTTGYDVHFRINRCTN